MRRRATKLSLSTSIALCLALAPINGMAHGDLSTPTHPANFLARRYKLGDVLHYEMKGSNNGWEYQLLATDTVRQDADGHFYEEIGWSDLRSNASMTLSPASLALRQTVSADGSGRYMAVPDLRGVQPLLIGPITDTLTFYSDLMFAAQASLGPQHPRAYVEQGKPNSWADGQHFLLAEDSIDFDLGFVKTDQATHTATFLVKHVVPTAPRIALPAAWMKTPIADTPNNWVQVSRQTATQQSATQQAVPQLTGYTAEIGKEIFEVRFTVDTRDGKLLDVHLDNPVTAVSRDCRDAALTDCGAPTPDNTHREVSLQLLP